MQTASMSLSLGPIFARRRRLPGRAADASNCGGMRGLSSYAAAMPWSLTRGLVLVVQEGELVAAVVERDRTKTNKLGSREPGRWKDACQSEGNLMFGTTAEEGVNGEEYCRLRDGFDGDVKTQIAMISPHAMEFLLHEPQSHLMGCFGRLPAGWPKLPSRVRGASEAGLRVFDATVLELFQS